MKITYSPNEYARLISRLPAPPERRSIRLRAGLSMRNVADELGVTPTAVRLWETGDRNVSPQLLRPYVEMLEDLRAATGGAQ